MKVYIATRFRTRPAALLYAAKLQAQGHEVVSRWLFNTIEEHDKRLVALDDLEDVRRCDELHVLSTDCELTPGGLWYEMGYAAALGKRVRVIGPAINVFCLLHQE